MGAVYDAFLHLRSPKKQSAKKPHGQENWLEREGDQGCEELLIPNQPNRRDARMTAVGQTRKSVTAPRMSAAGGIAEVDFGPPHVRV